MPPYTTSLPSKWRLLSAFAVLPLVDALMAFVAYPALWWLPTTAVFQPPDAAQAARGFAILAGVLGLLVTTCGAVPVVYWLMKRGPVSLAQLALAGLALGNMPFAIYAAAMIPFAIGHLVAGTMSQHLAHVSELLAGVVRALVIGSVLGVVSAVVFWLIGVRRVDAG
jgi:hypothetical protein